MIENNRLNRKYGYLLLAAATLQGCGSGTSESGETPLIGAAQQTEYITASSAEASSAIVSQSVVSNLTVTPGIATAQFEAGTGIDASVEAQPNPVIALPAPLEITPDPVIVLPAPVEIKPDPVAVEPAPVEIAPEPTPAEPTVSLPEVEIVPPEEEPIALPEVEIDPPVEQTMPEPEAPEQNKSETPAVAETVQPNTNGFLNDLPSSIQCYEFPENELNYGNIENDDWRTWVAPTDHRYSGSNEFLSIDKSADGKQTLMQKLVPSSRGSQTVSAAANLTSSGTYRITQSVFLEPGFDWGGKNEGGKLGFGLGGGSAPSGGLLQTDGFTVRFMWRGNKDGTAHVAVYSYAADREQSLPYGDDHPLEGFEIPVGKWFDLAMEVTVNSATNNSDGSLRAWANGELLLQLNNIQWQSSGDKPAVQRLIYSTFYGGNDSTWSPDKTTYIRFADVCWSPVLDEFEAVAPELGSASNAAQFRITKDAQGTIYSDFTEASEQNADFDEFADSPRAAIITAINDIELLLPTEINLIDYHLYTALERLNESLDTKDWVTNYAINAQAKTINKLFQSVVEMQATSAISDSPVFVIEQMNEISNYLALASADLAEEYINSSSDAFAASLCSQDSSPAHCQNATALLTQAKTDLATALEQMSSDPLRAIELSDQARKAAVSAINFATSTKN